MKSGCLSIAAALVLAAIGPASAQAPPAQQAPTPARPPAQKTIGQPTQGLVPSLIVFNSRGASLQGRKLVLSGISANAIVFADRPVRSAGHDLTAHIIEDWGVGNDSFAKNPPNATLSVFSKGVASVRDAVVVLKSPVMTGDTLTFDVDVLEGDIAGGDGAASLFIDIIGMPWTPMSYAGVARRTAYRAAWYNSAAAAAYYHPYYYPPPPPRCGYYPYPPCY
jgi:hypothetical protein